MQAEPLCRRYCKNKFDPFPQFSSPSLSILWKNAKTDGTKSFLAKQIQIKASFVLPKHLSEMFLSSKLTHRLRLLHDLKYV